MADRGIPFSAPMIRALLDGTKTQTRRIQAEGVSMAGSIDHSSGRPIAIDATAWDRRWPVKTKYAVGDRLWVREAWRTGNGFDEVNATTMAERCLDAGYKKPWAPIQYEADKSVRDWILDGHAFGTRPGRYRHARFMPRWASRLTLTVTDVRVQRLQDISEADAWAEGCKRGDPTDNGGYFPADEHDQTKCCVRGWDNARDWFSDLWDSLNGEGAWDANPWVAAYTFTVAHCNIDQVAA